LTPGSGTANRAQDFEWASADRSRVYEQACAARRNPRDMAAFSSDRRRRHGELSVLLSLLVALCAGEVRAEADPAPPAAPATPAAPTSAGTAQDAGVAADPDAPDAAAAAPSAEPSADAGTEPELDAEPTAPSAAAPAGPGIPATVCEGKKVARLSIAGQGRVSKDDILATIRLRAGVPCTDTDVTRDVQALWDMGYFADVRVEAKPVSGGIDLTFRVKERPAIAEVLYTGNDEIDTSDIQEKVTLEEGSVLSEPAVREQLEKIRQLYAEKGFFLAQVDYKLEPRPRNQVAVRFVIDEGDEVTVRRLHLIGNENLSASELRGVMQTSETGFLSFISSNNRYRKEIIDEDINRLQAYYYDFGYLMVEIGEPRIELTADRRHIDITISIKEGPRFKVGRVKALEIDESGAEVEPLAGRKQLRESVELNPGDWFSRSVIARDLQEITRYYRDRGYAHVEVTPQTDLHQDTRIVDVVVQIRRGPLVYIQRINVKGNNKTRDAVLRREARIVEGQLYNQSLVERSKDRMMSLGYFEKVELSEEDGATPDRMILNYEVTERPTGTFQLGAGFSSQETFLLTGQVQQENLFGRGQSLGLNLQLSGIRQLVQVRFVEPYFMGSDWSTAIEVFKILQQQISFNRDSTGGNLTLGHPLDFISDDLRIFLNYRLEFVSIGPATGGAFGSSGQAYAQFRFVPLRNLFRSGRTSSIRLSLTYDTRDNRLFPTKGLYISGSTEVSDEATLSQSNFIEHEINFRGYKPLFGPFVGKLNVNWGLITSRSGIGVPVFERYFLGGIFDMRGFPLTSLGPRLGSAASYNDPSFQLIPERGINFGGNMRFYYNLEIEFPIIESVGIKGVVFQDAGNAWNLEKSLCKPAPLSGDPTTDPCAVDVLRLRTSVGFGLRWFSPLGPLRFEWGFPFNRRKPYEDAVEFQFTVGNAF
jgi:outer membrane protein insertion porin family